MIEFQRTSVRVWEACLVRGYQVSMCVRASLIEVEPTFDQRDNDAVGYGQVRHV